uniref:Chitin-binding type-2 domain-containing protein n=1 Tax=Anopheles minimus TaxID=112268 RepID=A0A182WD68_9DIPT
MLTNVFILCSVFVLLASGADIDPRCSRYNLSMKAQVLSYQPDCRKFVICDMGGFGQVLSCPPGLYFNDEAHACSFDMASCTHGELDGPTNTLPLAPSTPVQPRPLPNPIPQVPVQPQPIPIPIPQVPVQPQPIPIPIPHVPVQPKPMPLPIPHVPVQPIPLPKPPTIAQIPQAPPVAQVTDSKPSLPNWLPIITAPPPSVVAPVEEQPTVEQLSAQSVCSEKPAGKIYPVAHDCGLYVVCMGSDSNAIVVRCPKGLLYDHRHQRCEYADASYCSTPRVDGHLVLDVNGVDMSLLEEERLNSLLEDTLSAEVTQKEHQPMLTAPKQPEKQAERGTEEYTFSMIENHPRCLARNNIHLTVELPHDTDCSKYLVCVGQSAIEKKCPTGQHWNAKHNWCDFASRAGCAL